MELFSVLFLLICLYYVTYILICVLCDCDVSTFLAEKFGHPVDVLSGKVIWITGASSGIGEHLAYACAKVGARLVLSARRESELQRVKEACLALSKEKLSSNDILVLPLDVSLVETHEAFFKKVMNHFGSLDILVNNAGRSQRAIWEEIELEVDRSLFELNVFGVVNMTRLAVKYFSTKGSGHVAVTSSTAGIMGVPHSGTYTATKHALHGYFDSLRTEKFLKNISVTVFCPGPTFTNFLQESYTGRAGEKYGQAVRANDKRMTGERCGYLFAVALANKIDEPWAAIFPIIALSYLNQYFPNVLKGISTFLGPKYLLKLRDSRVALKVESSDQ